MARYNQDWDDLGRSIQDIVDRAVNSQDYQKLNQTIRLVVDRAVDMGSEAVRKVMDSNSRPDVFSQEMNRSAVPEQKILPALYGSTGGKTTKGILKVVGGSLLSGSTFLMLLASVFFVLTGGSILPSLLTLAGIAGGVGLICSGANTLNRLSRYKTYRRVLGHKTHCTLEKLARSVDKSVKYVRSDVQKMIGEGLFLEGHMDQEETCLITSDETYQHYEQSRLQFEQRQREEAASKTQAPAASQEPQIQEVLNRGNAFIAEIRRCNDEIPGEEISAKIDRMEMIVRRIFARAEAHPEIIPDLKKLMDYYLPMTVKLLNAYADMDAQPTQGETISNSKQEIEATLDTLNLAFEKLLDDLFKDTALDVSSDISVLNTLLAQEGLAEDGLSQMKKQQNP